jgi:hypothetical protein
MLRLEGPGVFLQTDGAGPQDACNNRTESSGMGMQEQQPMAMGYGAA